jgi:hypothetical protein
MLAGLTPGCVIKRLRRKELQSTARKKAQLQYCRSTNGQPEFSMWTKALATTIHDKILGTIH